MKDVDPAVFELGVPILWVPSKLLVGEMYFDWHRFIEAFGMTPFKPHHRRSANSMRPAMVARWVTPFFNLIPLLWLTSCRKLLGRQILRTLLVEQLEVWNYPWFHIAFSNNSFAQNTATPTSLFTKSTAMLTVFSLVWARPCMVS